MKKQIFLLASVLLLNGCASTVKSALQDTTENIQQTTEYIRKNPDVVDNATSVMKSSSEFIGKSMKVTGDLLQKIAK
ncbi:putative periplasmic lipoprotein [Alysiella filiformis]|uniref:Lipoprotein n=1 Tax=Alysiella filiformis DSM 16848 TaxID=1120981 RepID=A0A286E5Y0_9NEIS|nr:hypothetical protein [Alysiella filiformis]QMT32373.1 hypothetical protein H3L97_05985 [Alysiella filiformis]UBQ56706.1 hypothetical protein JF568_02705 [Alysiella filiformis DSM 16848]SOD66315.1 hypothetical protein SAMN02746062_00583 [Alysiella filiformis DSM 16848]